MQILIKTFHIYFKPKRINLLFQPKVHLDRALASCAKNKLSMFPKHYVSIFFPASRIRNWKFVLPLFLASCSITFAHNDKSESLTTTNMNACLSRNIPCMYPMP